jgi:hypothetical protein
VWEHLRVLDEGDEHLVSARGHLRAVGVRRDAAANVLRQVGNRADHPDCPGYTCTRTALRTNTRARARRSRRRGRADPRSAPSASRSCSGASTQEPRRLAGTR